MHSEFHCFHHGLVVQPIELVEIEPEHFQHSVKGSSLGTAPSELRVYKWSVSH